MKHAIFSLIILFAFITLKAQKVNLQLFYEINQFESGKNYQRLDSFLSTIKAKSINLHIIGYADFLYNEDYNMALSLKRANLIKKHISTRTKEPHINVLSTKANGEKQSKDSELKAGEPLQRRVDIVIESSSTNTNVNTRPVQIEEPLKEEKIPIAIAGKRLEEIEIGQSIELEGISFVPGYHTVLESSIPIMHKLLQTLKNHPQLKIEIQGHVCCVEDFKPDAMDYGTRQRKLSVTRAKTIFDFLIRNGINKERLTYKGFGHKRPKVSPETTPEEEQMNRRVEVMVIEK